MTRKFYPLAMVVGLLVVLVFGSYPLSARAQANGWDFITVAPESGNWNLPGTFILTAQREVTVSWLIKCTYGGCNRPADEVNDFTFTAGQSIQVGWGHQCYAWQFDEVGGVGFIAEAEPDLCAPAATPTPTAVPTSTATPTSIPPTATLTATPTAIATATAVPPGTSTATPTATEPVSATPTATSTVAGATATAIVATPTFTLTPPPTVPPQPQATEVVILPVTGQAPPASPLSSPLWPALAALLLLVLSGRLVWTGILQAENTQILGNATPALRSQARKVLILIVVSVLILATLVLPSIFRQAALDFGEPSSYSPQSPSIVQPALLNSSAVQPPALKVQEGPQALDQRLPGPSQLPAPVNGNPPAVAPAASQVDTSPVTRLAIPDLKVDEKVEYIPFKDQTWNIETLGMEIAWLGNTSSPGLGGNTVLAGHITVLYLGNGPFRYLYTLKPGERVYVYTDENVYLYSVREQAVVQTNDPRVVGPTDRAQLTLLTCTGWDNETLQYTKRRAVFADLLSVAPISYHKTDAWPQGH